MDSSDAGKVMKGEGGGLRLRLKRDKVTEKDPAERTNERQWEVGGGTVITSCMFKQRDNMS